MDTQDQIAVRLAQVLWCKPDRMYSVSLADADAGKLTEGHGEAPAPVAAGSAE